MERTATIPTIPCEQRQRVPRHVQEVGSETKATTRASFETALQSAWCASELVLDVRPRVVVKMKI